MAAQPVCTFEESRRITREHAHTFYFASHMLPARSAKRRMRCMLFAGTQTTWWMCAAGRPRWLRMYLSAWRHCA